MAAALEGRADALFITLVPLKPPDDSARRLAAVPPEVAKAFAGFAARLQRAGGTFALVMATRAENGALYPHAHGLVGGVPLEKLGRWAALEGLLIHTESLRSPRAAARYIVASGQKKYFDSLLGARGFYASCGQAGVSSRNKKAGAPEPAPIYAGLELGPGVRIADADVFLTALKRDLNSRIPAVQAAARHRLALLQKVLENRGPP